MNGLTTFEIDETPRGILVSKKFSGKTIKKTYAVDREDAELIRGIWVDEFWGVGRN